MSNLVRRYKCHLVEPCLNKEEIHKIEFIKKVLDNLTSFNYNYWLEEKGYEKYLNLTPDTIFMYKSNYVFTLQNVSTDSIIIKYHILISNYFMIKLNINQTYFDYRDDIDCETNDILKFLFAKKFNISNSDIISFSTTAFKYNERIKKYYKENIKNGKSTQAI